MTTSEASILVVDDDKIYRMLLTEHLKKLGFHVEQANDGQQALKRLSESPFDVVLLDLMMPEMDGFQVLEIIQQDPRLSTMPVIVISAMDDTESVVRCIKAGAVDYLPKPFEPLILQARIHASLANKRIREVQEVYSQELNAVNTRLQAIFQGASIGITIIDKDGKLVRFNPAFEHMMRYPADELEGKDIIDLTHPEDRDENIKLFQEQMRGELDHFVMEKRYVRRNDDTVWVRLTSALVRDADGQPQYSISMIEDITAHKVAESRLQHLNFFDPLTGLFNRTYYEEELDRLNHSRFYPITILTIDIDGLNEINKMLGKEAGDEVLKRAANILREVFRAEDLVARTGDDEFSIVLPTVDNETAQKVLERVRQRLDEENRRIQSAMLNLSIGVATGNEGMPLPEIAQTAAISLREAKKAKQKK